VASAEEIGVESNVALKAQSEQMKATNQDIAEVDEGIRRANTGEALLHSPQLTALFLLLRASAATCSPVRSLPCSLARARARALSISRV